MKTIGKIVFKYQKSKSVVVSSEDKNKFRLKAVQIANFGKQLGCSWQKGKNTFSIQGIVLGLQA